MACGLGKKGNSYLLRISQWETPKTEHLFSLSISSDGQRDSLEERPVAKWFSHFNKFTNSKLFCSVGSAVPVLFDWLFTILRIYFRFSNLSKSKFYLFKSGLVLISAIHPLQNINKRLVKSSLDLSLRCRSKATICFSVRSFLSSRFFSYFRQLRSSDRSTTPASMNRSANANSSIGATETARSSRGSWMELRSPAGTDYPG